MQLIALDVGVEAYVSEIHLTIGCISDRFAPLSHTHNRYFDKLLLRAQDLRKWPRI